MKQQTLTFLRRDSGFGYKNNSAYVELENELILVDCGFTVFEQVKNKFDLMKYKKIKIIITHLHNDHAGSLSQLILYDFFVKNKKIMVLSKAETIVYISLGGTMKRFILLNPEEVSHVYDKLIGSRLACAEIEFRTAKDIEEVAREAVSEGRGCADLTEIFSRSPERHEGRKCEYILVKNEVLIDELTSRVFNVIAEYNDMVVITAR